MDNALSIHQGNDATLTNDKQDNIIALSGFYDLTTAGQCIIFFVFVTLDSSLRHIDSFRNMIAVASRRYHL